MSSLDVENYFKFFKMTVKINFKKKIKFFSPTFVLQSFLHGFSLVVVSVLDDDISVVFVGLIAVISVDNRLQVLKFIVRRR